MLAAAQAATAGMSLDAVLGNMDRASAQFRGLEADFQWVTYTALVDDKIVEPGHVKVRRSGAGEAEVLFRFADPYAKDVLVKDSKVEIYRPKIKTVEEYDASKDKDKLDRGLLVAFGASGTTIRKNYDAKLGGEETVAGEPTARLELVPKDAESRKKLPKFEMWISTKNWQTVQLKFYEDLASGDYRLHTYTDVELKPPLKDSDFELDLPKGVKRIRPQK